MASMNYFLVIIYGSKRIVPTLEMRNMDDNTVHIYHYITHFTILFDFYYLAGVIGDWKNQFTVAQSEQFDALMNKNSMHSFVL